MKAHFIGIAGVGMAGTALLLRDLGWEITGSDEGFYPPMSTHLEEKGVSFLEGYKAEHIPKDADLIVIGKNAKLNEENPEVKTAFESGITIRSFPEVLGGLVEEKESIVVSGSYGKSSITALISWVLQESKKDPSFFIGAVPIDMSHTTRLGDGEQFVFEGDEYPSANWDKTSKFLYYHPKHVLLTSGEHDHINVFPTHEEYLAPFQSLIGLIPEDGSLTVCASDKHAMEIAQAFSGRKIFYGLSENADWTAKNISYGETTTFDLMHDNVLIASLTTRLLGKHNVENIVGASALLLSNNMVTPEELKKAVGTFHGIKRRLDKKTEKSAIPVYEGFGSSYAKAKAAIEAMQTHFPTRRLVTIFEPHTFSWRNKDAIHWYDTIFSAVDEILVYEPATQGAQTHEQLTQKEIIERIEKGGTSVTAIHSKEDGLSYLEKNLKEGDAILLLTSGDLGGLIEATTRFVEEKFPK